MEYEVAVDRLSRLLAELVRTAQLLQKSEAGCCGISLSQCHLLLEIFQRSRGGASLSELAATLQLDLSTVSRVADGLVRRGLLQRETDPADRRRTVLLLTPRGRELVETIRRGTKKYFREILRQVPAEKHQVVLEGLDLLVKALRNLKGGCCP